MTTLLVTVVSLVDDAGHHNSCQVSETLPEPCSPVVGIGDALFCLYSVSVVRFLMDTSFIMVRGRQRRQWLRLLCSISARGRWVAKSKDKVVL